MNQQEQLELRRHIDERLQQHHVQIKGAEQPHAIPFAALMESFFRAYGYEQDDAGLIRSLRLHMPLDERDATTLAREIRAKGPSTESEELSARARDLSSALAQTSDAAEASRLGREMNKVQQESESIRENRYRAALDKLSVVGRRSVEEYLSRDVAPRITHIRVDYEGLYAEAARLLPEIKRLEPYGFAGSRVDAAPDAGSSGYTGSDAFRPHTEGD